MANRKSYADDDLKAYELKNFAGGYNSYSQSRAMLKDNEIPVGQNVVLDDNGSATKVLGSSRYGDEVSAGNPIVGMSYLFNSSHNKLIVASGTKWYQHSATANSELSGATFTANQETDFTQAIDRLYGANNTDPLSYTDDGSTITQVTVNGNVGRWPIYYNQRLYMTNASFPDRIYYSNPTTTTESSYAVGNFGTFDTDLSATPKKNAGFIILIPGGGVEIVCLIKDSYNGSDFIYALTKRHGLWKITYNSVNADGSIAHTISQVVPYSGSYSGRSVGKYRNDLWWYDGDNAVTQGEVANYATQRITAKSGRAKTEFDSIPAAYKNKVALGVFKDKLYFAYTTSTYNNRILIYDSILNAWSTPIVGKNISQFIEFIESDGTRRFLGASSDPSDSYVYQLEDTLNDSGTAIDAYFETKSTDCNKPGLVKRFAFAKIFYSSVFGTLNYEVFLDEVSSITGQLQLGSSRTGTSGIGVGTIGNRVVGVDSGTAVIAFSSTNDDIPVQTDYLSGKKISIKFSNNVVGETFKIDRVVFYYIEGSIYEG